MTSSRTIRIAVRRFGPFESAIRAQFDTWTPPHEEPIELELVPLEVEPLYDEAVGARALAEGRYDIAFLVTDWLPKAIAEDHLLDLGPWVRRTIPHHDSTWSTSLRAVQQKDDRIYGLPYHDGPQCLIYRHDLFDDPQEQSDFRHEHGRPLTVPETWDEYLEVARWFTRTNDQQFGTVVAAFPDAHNTVYDLCLQIWSRGGEIVNASGQPSLDTAQAREGLDWYRALVKDENVTHPVARKIDSVRAGEIFAEGRAAMMQNWFGFAAHAQIAEDSAVQGRVSVAPVPSGPGGQPSSFLVYWLLAVGAGCSRPDLAFDFVRHATSAQSDVLTTLHGGIGCRIDTWSHPAVLEAIPFFDQMAGLHDIARTLPADPMVPALAQIIDELVTNALESDESSGNLLSAAQDKATSLYAESRR